MRIIAGQAGSIPLTVPKTLTRPTTDRVREAIFSSLCDQITGSTVLDLFAGSGSLGIEALSRGAAAATFVDDAKASIETVESNLDRASLENGRTVRRDALGFLASIRPESFDLIFADPPYARDEATLELLTALIHDARLSAALKPGGLLILETLASVPLPDSSLWELAKDKKYGTTRVNYLLPRR